MEGAADSPALLVRFRDGHERLGDIRGGGRPPVLVIDNCQAITLGTHPQHGFHEIIAMGGWND